jgi:hypothetical protein
MPSIYEALMRAAEEREALKKQRPSTPSGEAVDPKPAYNLEEEMLVLLEAFESLLPRSRRTVVQFTGSQGGEIASTMAREYASFSASATGRSVLFLEPGKASPSFGPSTPSAPDARDRERDPDGHPAEPLFQQVKDLSLFVSKTANGALLDAACGAGPSKDLVWTLLKDRFDLIVIDASLHRPCTGDGNLAFAPSLDGVLLVFDSDLTLSEDGANSVAFGLASILEVVARGVLLPQQVVTCMGALVLILTPAGG